MEKDQQDFAAVVTHAHCTIYPTFSFHNFKLSTFVFVPSGIKTKENIKIFTKKERKTKK